MFFFGLTQAHFVPTSTDFMKLVMTLLVRDEDDILRENLEFHYAHGVDFIIATDNKSQDGTFDILQQYQSEGRLHLISESGDNYDQSSWVTRMARLAYTEYGADWVINSDADEFWWPEEGALPDVFARIAQECKLVGFVRHNFVPLELDSGESPFWMRMIYRQKCSTNDLGHPLPPKACHKAAPDVRVGMGNHSVDGFHARNAVMGSCSILHFPKRSYQQFQRKIKLGGAAVLRNQGLAPGQAGTWKHLYGLLEGGRLEKWFQENCLSSVEADKLCHQGELIRDTRLRDFLSSILRSMPRD